MIRGFLVAVVGMAMGGLIGLLVASLGAGNVAIFAGAAAGGVIFWWAIRRIGRAT
jgi:hypothetical protein